MDAAGKGWQGVARGWESKAVEEQQLERERRAATAEARVPADPRREAHRRTLELARARAADDLSRARHEAHREMLRRTLAALDAQIAALPPR
jgi:hypothetical protein